MKKYKPTYPAAVAVLTLGAIYSSQTMAENWADKVTIGGFASAVYQVSDQATQFNGESGVTEDGAFQGTRMGININARLDDNLTLFSQLLATQEDNDYRTDLDWAFISYKAGNEWQLRAGKIKFPAGLVNEYVSVGTLYPWIAPPALFYSADMAGPQVTREAYTGFSAVWERNLGDWTVSSDIYAGEVSLPPFKAEATSTLLSTYTVRKLTGLTLKADWNDTFQLQATTFSGTMDIPDRPPMDGEKHSSTLVGAKMDWNNIVGYAEWADVKMGSAKMGAGTSWYTTLGYRIDRWLPNITYQYFDKGLDTADLKQEQNMTTYGVKYALTRNASLKFEYSTIETVQGQGLFAGPVVDKSSDMYGVAIDVTF